MDEEILFIKCKAHLTGYDVSLVATDKMTRRRKSYVRDYPHDNASLEEQDHPNSYPGEQLQDRDQDSDLKGERIESRQHDVTYPDHRPMVYDQLGHDDIVE